MSPKLAVVAAVVLALPAGWGLGVLLAYAIAGRNFGQLPALTVPLGMAAALIFALWPSLPPSIRFKVMLCACGMFIVLGMLVA